MSIMYPHSLPPTGFLGSGGPHAFVATTSLSTAQNKASTDKDGQAYPLGTAIGYFNAIVGGYGVCVYMEYDQDSASDVAAVGDVCTLLSGSHTVVTNDASGGAVGTYAKTAGVPACIALSTMTDAYHGWFWAKGVCPDLWTAAATRLDAATDLVSAGNIGAASAFIASTTDDNIALHNRDAATNDVSVMGISIAADSTLANTFSNIRLLGHGWGF